MTHTGSFRGLTLIEVLVTTVLIGLVAAVLLHSFGDAQHERAAFRALLRELRDLDARARLVARSGEAVELSHDGTSGRVVIRGSGGGSIIAERELPPGATCSIRLKGARSARAIAFDPIGASRDYTLDVEFGQQRARLDVAGLTGWVTQSEPSP